MDKWTVTYGKSGFPMSLKILEKTSQRKSIFFAYHWVNSGVWNENFKYSNWHLINVSVCEAYNMKVLELQLLNFLKCLYNDNKIEL